MVALALGTAFLALACPHLDRHFGRSHDGRNGATWGLASRALRENGIIDSRAGAELAHNNGVYGRHPPLIVWETAVAETVAGERPWVTRAPAWMSTLASFALLAALLRVSGLSVVASSVGLVIGGTSAMALFYGTMLDTPMISLPVALAVLVLLQLERLGRRVPAWAMFLAPLIAVLAGWQAALLAGIAASTHLPRAIRTRRPTALQLGFVTGTVTVLGWLLWAHGGWGPVLDDLSYRTGADTRPGGGSPGWWTFLDAQFTYSVRLFGVVGTILLVPSFALVAWLRRFRPVGVVLVAACLGYPILLHEGAVKHDYWNFWWIAPLALGSAALFELVHAQLVGSPARMLVVSLVGVIVASGIAFALFAAREAGSGQLATSAELPESQTFVATGPEIENARWLAYATRRELLELDDTSAVSRFARSHPNDLVLVSCDSPLAETACDDGQSLRFVAGRDLRPETQL